MGTFGRWTAENCPAAPQTKPPSLQNKQHTGLGGSHTTWGASGTLQSQLGTAQALKGCLGCSRAAALLEKAPVGCHLSLAAARDPRALTPSPHPPSVLSSLVVPQTVPKMPVPAVTQVCRAAWAMAASRLPRHEISHCSPKNIPLSSPTAPLAEGLGAVGQGGVGDKTHQCGVPDTKGPQKGSDRAPSGGRVTAPCQGALKAKAAAPSPSGHWEHGE